MKAKKNLDWNKLYGLGKGLWKGEAAGRGSCRYCAVTVFFDRAARRKR